MTLTDFRKGERLYIGPDKATTVEVCDPDEADMTIEGTPVKYVDPEILAKEAAFKKATHATVRTWGPENNRAARRKAKALARKKQ